MISDVLSDAISKINEYLEEPLYGRVYGGEIRDKILSLMDEMEKLRIELDEVPCDEC